MVAVSPPPVLFGPEIPSPCFVIDERRLIANANVLAGVQERTGAKILLALKAFAAWETFPLLSAAFSGPLRGVCASSVDEARLGAEKFGGEVHAFAAAWSEEEIRELMPLVDHLVFNSIDQFLRFSPLVAEANRGERRDSPISVGLRINPEHSEGATAIYNPCAPGSRLGIRPAKFAEATDLAQVSGLHFHTLCEQDAPALIRTLAAVEQKFPLRPGQYQWLNFGGGHHITRADYQLELLEKTLVDWRDRYKAQIYLEPGEAVALDAGWLTAEVLDIVEADIPVAILNTSAACHTPDVLEMPYTPKVWRMGEYGPEEVAIGGRCRLAGKSCLAGDVIGEYDFAAPLKRGERIVFQDMAIYSMVKTTTFNGLRLPSIGVLDSRGVFRLIKKFGYADFRDRLS